MGTKMNATSPQSGMSRESIGSSALAGPAQSAANLVIESLSEFGASHVFLSSCGADYVIGTSCVTTYN
jgi:hypothetical protein